MIAEVSGYYQSYSHVFPSKISSSSNQLFITFTSDEWYGSNGFKARIGVEPLINATMSTTNTCSMRSLCLANQGHCQSDNECQGYLKCGHNNCPLDLGYHPKTRCCYDYCSQWLDMENGVLSSPWYPNNYPQDIRCSTLMTVGMTVAGPRTITLEFLMFKVSNFYP